MWVSLGKVVVPAAGTPVRATANQADPTTRFPAHAILFQQVAGNTGKIWIGTAALVTATGMGVLAVLAIPTANTQPSASATVTMAPVGFDLSTYRIDADVGGEGCYVSALVF